MEQGFHPAFSPEKEQGDAQSSPVIWTRRGGSGKFPPVRHGSGSFAVPDAGARVKGKRGRRGLTRCKVRQLGVAQPGQRLFRGV